jgi:hypothetical protein
MNKTKMQRKNKDNTRSALKVQGCCCAFSMLNTHYYTWKFSSKLLQKQYEQIEQNLENNIEKLATKHNLNQSQSSTTLESVPDSQIRNCEQEESKGMESSANSISTSASFSFASRVPIMYLPLEN